MGNLDRPKMQRRVERTRLSMQGLYALLDFVENLDRKDVEAVYLQSKKILMAGRSHVIQSD